MAGASFASTSHAALYTRLGGLAVYDDDINITWLADANYAQTSGYAADGYMKLADANAWAASLNIGGYTGWRLPTADPSCGFSYCTTSELGHLFYTELGATAGDSIFSASNTAGLALFNNILLSFPYLSPAEPPPNIDLMWVFYANYGSQGFHLQNDVGYAWAVRDGDIGGGSVPEPGILGLMAMGALAWAGTRQQRRR